ncbi:UBX domain-containing protein 4 [Clydaea vesicula]|uniref:UBX domain-containing protein 4 n=1 Tax=Clydaea vesicula TaxID=447962 RepID=A0AAD5U6R8_9FUNG|nr:UBX domain-containing protein 4 [Clydaea vesicula]
MHQVWYNGTIENGVLHSRDNKLPFLVFITVSDEISRKFEVDIENSLLKFDKFIAIMINKESESFLNFTAIWPVLKTPSLYLIKDGLVVDIIINDLSSAELDISSTNDLETNLGSSSNDSSVKTQSAKSKFSEIKKIKYEMKRYIEREGNSPNFKIRKDGAIKNESSIKQNNKEINDLNSEKELENLSIINKNVAEGKDFAVNIKPSCEYCNLKIRLFDGSTLSLKFPARDEFKTFTELELIPSSLITLKKANEFSEAFKVQKKNTFLKFFSEIDFRILLYGIAGVFKNSLSFFTNLILKSNAKKEEEERDRLNQLRINRLKKSNQTFNGDSTNLEQ